MEEEQKKRKRMQKRKRRWKKRIEGGVIVNIWTSMERGRVIMLRKTNRLRRKTMRISTRKEKGTGGRGQDEKRRLSRK